MFGGAAKKSAPGGTAGGGKAAPPQDLLASIRVSPMLGLGKFLTSSVNTRTPLIFFFTSARVCRRFERVSEESNAYSSHRTYSEYTRYEYNPSMFHWLAQGSRGVVE